MAKRNTQSFSERVDATIERFSGKADFSYSDLQREALKLYKCLYGELSEKREKKSGSEKSGGAMTEISLD